MRWVLLLFSFIVFVPQGNAQTSLKQAVDDFHYTLAFTYHPMADDSNYQPIRNRSAELLEKARLIEKAMYGEASLPEEIESKIDVLVSSCAALHDVIQQGATDTAIFSRLSRIHDLFHDVEHAVIEWEQAQKR
ncbi:MAG: hypothetical protein NZL95_04145 [Chitinophagales bacterium]|nr:hypothetical protein [Chitinophagales bacterium]MDW8427721.1 hypothetical protein [Chitinophagales bacterium]